MHRNMLILTAAMILVGGTVAQADIFGEGVDQFTIDFVTISGDAGDVGSWPAGHFMFTGVDRDDYRMGVFEITNDQWNKFASSLGVPVTGAPSEAYELGPFWTDADRPTNAVSWFEAAQFVNWLNTSTGHQAAYKFTGTQGTGDYAFDVWSEAEAAGGTNLYRHKDAMYYMPTEDEWVKAAYWNGSSLQTYATKPGDMLHQGDGVGGTGWNYSDNGYATDPYGPWNVGSGSEELNETYDMMGNLWEWIEDPWFSGDYTIDSNRVLRGGSYYTGSTGLASSFPISFVPYNDSGQFGFRVAANVPEPSTLALLSLGGLIIARRRRR